MNETIVYQINVIMRAVPPNALKRIFNQVTYPKNESNVVHKNAPTVPTLVQALHEIFMVKEKITRSFFIG